MVRVPGYIAGGLVGGSLLLLSGGAGAAGLEMGGAWSAQEPGWREAYDSQSLDQQEPSIRLGDWALTAARQQPAEIWDAALPAATATALSPGGYVALRYSDWRFDISSNRYSLPRGKPLSVLGIGVGYEWKPADEVAVKVGPRSHQSFTSAGAETDVGLGLAATLQFTPRWAVTGTASVTQGLNDGLDLSEEDPMRSSRFTTGLFFSFRF